MLYKIAKKQRQLADSSPHQGSAFKPWLQMSYLCLVASACSARSGKEIATFHINADSSSDRPRLKQSIFELKKNL